MSEHRCEYRDQWESVNRSRQHWIQQAEKLEAERDSPSCEGKLKDAVIDAARACIAAWDDAKWPPSIDLRKALKALDSVSGKQDHG